MVVLEAKEGAGRRKKDTAKRAVASVPVRQPQDPGGDLQQASALVEMDYSIFPDGDHQVHGRTSSHIRSSNGSQARRCRNQGRRTERNPLVLMETGSVANRVRGLRRLIPSAAIATACVVAIMAAPCARGDSVSALPHAPGLTGPEGKGKGLLTSLETLFKKNCELLGKLRVELNDFSEGLDSLRELACRADSKLKYAFGSNYIGSYSTESTSSYDSGSVTAKSTPEAQETPAARDSTAEREVSPHEDPANDRQGLRASSPMLRGDLGMPMQLNHIRRTMSIEDIVLTEEDEQDTKPMDEVVCFLDLDKCTIYGQDGNDLAIAMQWMGRPASSVVELYRRLMNPQIKPLMKQVLPR